MEDLITKFGTNAGKLWSALNEKGPIIKEDITKNTKLNDNDFYTAVGWLAREDKIYKEGQECYKLGNTNLTHEIGANAGRLWRILDIWGEVDFSSIKKLAGIDEKEIFSALGWLARENKINLDEKHRFTLK